jgi:hypothetical protein
LGKIETPNPKSWLYKVLIDVPATMATESEVDIEKIRKVI